MGRYQHSRVILRPMPGIVRPEQGFLRLTRVILARACGTFYIPQQPLREITRQRTFALFLGPDGDDPPAVMTGEKRKPRPPIRSGVTVGAQSG